MMIIPNNHNWQIKKLGDLCDIELGKTPYRGNKRYWDGNRKTGNVWLSIADLLYAKNKIIYDSKEYITDEGAKLSKIVKKGTLLVSFKLTLGRLAFAGIDLYTNEAIAALNIKNQRELSKDYLHHFLSFFDWHGATKGVVKVKGKTLNKAKLKEIIVSYPSSLPEQQRIVDILDKAFAAIEIAKKNTEKILENAKEIFESYLQNVFAHPDDKWVQQRLGNKDLLEIIDGDRGKNYPNKNDFSEKGFCLFMNTKNVRPNGLDLKTTMFISEKKDKLLGNGKLQRGDVVMTTRGTIGNLGIYSNDVKYQDIRINSGMLIFRPNLKIISSEYLFEILRSGIIKTQIRTHVSGAAQPQLPIKTLINFAFPVPKSLLQQQAIVSKLYTLSFETKKLESLYQQKLANLEELKKSLLKKAFNGEL